MPPTDAKELYAMTAPVSNEEEHCVHFVHGADPPLGPNSTCRPPNRPAMMTSRGSAEGLDFSSTVEGAPHDLPLFAGGCVGLLCVCTARQPITCWCGP